MSQLKVKLGNYKGIRVPKLDRTISDREMQVELDRAARCAARVFEKEAAENGDCVIIDFQGFLEGESEPFEGGTEKDCALELGSGRFIPGFEEQLLGVGKGEKKDVTIVFPDDYQAEALAGRPAVFKVEVKSVRGMEVPELTDEIIKKVSDQSTIAEFKEFVTGEILKKREADYVRQKEDFIVAKIVEDAEVNIPEMLIEERAEQIRKELEKQLSNSGKSLEQYLQANGLSQKEYEKLSKEDAKTMLEGEAVLDEIAEAEGFGFTKDELEQEISKMADLYNVKVKELRSMMGLFGEEMLGQDIKSRKALEFVIGQSVEV